MTKPSPISCCQLAEIYFYNQNKGIDYDNQLQVRKAGVCKFKEQMFKKIALKKLSCFF